MEKRFILKSIVAAATRISMFNKSYNGNEFEIRNTEIFEKGQMATVKIIPFCSKYGKMRVTYFEKEGEIIIHCNSKEAEKFASQLKEAGELTHTNCLVAIVKN